MKPQNLKDVNVDEFFDLVGNSLENIDRKKIMKLAKYISIQSLFDSSSEKEQSSSNIGIKKNDFINIIIANSTTIEEAFSQLYYCLQIISSDDPILSILFQATECDDVVPADKDNELYISDKEMEEIKDFITAHSNPTESHTPPETFAKYQKIEGSTWKTEIVNYILCAEMFITSHNSENEQ